MKMDKFSQIKIDAENNQKSNTLEEGPSSKQHSKQDHSQVANIERNRSAAPQARSKCVATKVRESKAKKGAIEPLGDVDSFLQGLIQACGSTDRDLAFHFMSQAARTVYGKTTESERCNIILAVLHGIAPKDEIEGMLAVQMVGTHNLAMEFMRRAMFPDQTVDGTNFNTDRATKMLRTFTAQVEALNCYRGKGQQKVTVEYVKVEDGGQAIIGNVDRPKSLNSTGGDK